MFSTRAVAPFLSRRLFRPPHMRVLSPAATNTVAEGPQACPKSGKYGNVALVAATVAGVGAFVFDGYSKTQAESVNFDEIFRSGMDGNDDEGHNHVKHGDKKCCDKDDEEQEENDVPEYIAEHFKKDLGNALSHKTPIGSESRHLLRAEMQYPRVEAKMTLAPEVPPPTGRNYPVTLVVDIMTINKAMRVKDGKKYEFWPFAFLDYRDRKIKYGVPGPMVRARVGDILEVNHTNKDQSGMAHSIDFHSVCGPGGGSPTTFAEQDETRTGAYRLMKPGVFVYHCAAAPIPLHIHNGMFGLIIVEPEEGLPKVDKEFYIMQHELYLSQDEEDPQTYEHDYDAACRENPSHVVFNGRENSMIDKPLMVKQDETVRLWVGNAGPNLVSSFHVIGTVFDKVYREGDLMSQPARNIQTTLIPSGGAAVIDMKMQVCGNFAIVDHSINRIDKGAVGFLKVKGKPRPDIYDSAEPPRFCPGCKTHN